MEKILKCSFNKLGNCKGYDIIQLPVDDIWQSVPSVDVLPAVPNKPFKKTLIEDIATNGMNFPILVVKTSYKDLMELKQKYGASICELPFWHNNLNPQSKYQWSVWGGSQRLDVAKKLNYTHIDCAILPSVAKAISHQREMRRPYNNKYYR